MKQIIISVITILSLFSCKEKAFTPGDLWLDNNNMHINAHGGGILFINNTFYWFGQHMIEGEIGNSAQVGVHCYSSSNLYDWKDEGIAFRVSDDVNSQYVKGCILERPKVIYNKKTNKYVMWFHLEPLGTGYKSALSAVAISDTPVGPYVFVRAFRPNAGHWPLNVPAEEQSTKSVSENQTFNGGEFSYNLDSLNIIGRDMMKGQMARDMNLFVDDDGKAYHIYSSEENSTLHISLLNEDYTGCSGKYIRVFPGRFHEGATMFKHEGKYYLIASGCTGWSPNKGRSAVATSIFGSWKELKNPFVGKDADLSFHSQSTFVLPVSGKNEQLIYMGDRWTPENPIDGRYIWLPIHFDGEQPIIEWKAKWSY